MNYKNTLEEIKKEMRIRAITDELLAEQIKMPKEKLKRKLDGGFLKVRRKTFLRKISPLTIFKFSDARWQ